MVTDEPKRTLRQLMDEYRPSMNEDILRAWAADVIAVWEGPGMRRSGEGDFEDRMFFQGFGFAVGHLARDMRDNHMAKMIVDQNGFRLDQFLTADLDPYDLDPLKVALAETDFDEDGETVQRCPDCGEMVRDLLDHLQNIHGEGS